MLKAGVLLQEAARTASESGEPRGVLGRIIEIIDTPLPYSPLSEYLVLLFVLWLIARHHRRRRETFETQAQEVLDEKYAQGELSRKAYEKFRQDLVLRPKR